MSGAGREAKGSLVLIASADAALRTRWLRSLERAFAIGSVDDVVALRADVAARQPAVLVLDRDLIDAAPARCVERVCRLSPGTRILVLTTTPRPIDAAAILRAGAQGYHHAAIDPLLLERAVAALLKGELWVSREILTNVLLEHLQKPHPPARVIADGSRALAGLSPRERQVAGLIAIGASNREIASSLSVREATIKAHLTTVFRKLGIRDRLRLALLVKGSEPARNAS